MSGRLDDEQAQRAQDRRRAWTLELDAEPVSAAMARRFIGGTLGLWIDTDLEDNACLVVTELVTNAIRHAGTALQLTVILNDDVVRVEVTDTSGNVVERTPGVASSASESGRGLHIVDALASEWGVESAPGGKRVWADLRRG
jgi:anti-sigma regulatory factor (Ser/Thr protein kinase)